MKKGFKFYLAFWAVLLVLFNVIAFVSVGWEGYEKYTASFWIGYAAVMLAFAVNIICTFVALKAETAKKMFYNLPLVTITYGCLIASFVVGGLCMLLTMLPGYVAAIVSGIVIVVNVVSLFKATAAADLIEKTDEKVAAKTFFMKSLAVDAQALMAKADTPEAKEACKKVFEAVRYADPMTNDKLADVEEQISAKFGELSAAVAGGADNIGTIVDEFVSLVKERSEKCKLLK